MRGRRAYQQRPLPPLACQWCVWVQWCPEGVEHARTHSRITCGYVRVMRLLLMTMSRALRPGASSKRRCSWPRSCTSLSSRT